MRRLFWHEFRQTDRHVPHLRLGPEEGEEVPRREIAQFPHVDRLCDLLLAYEADCRSHPTLESFFPRIVQEFERIAVGGTSPVRGG